MKVALGSDHGGYILKEIIKKHLAEKGFEVQDFGTHSDVAVDYPDIALQIAMSVQKNENHRGILVCGTGIGMAITANKIKGIRAAVCHDTFSAQACREHNDANVLALGERVIGPGLATAVVDVWLKAEFAGGRHSRRVDKIRSAEGLCQD